MLFEYQLSEILNNNGTIPLFAEQLSYYKIDITHLWDTYVEILVIDL